MDALEKAQLFLELVEESSALRVHALGELDRVILIRYGSRRSFFSHLPERIISAATWGRWVRGEDEPRKAHLDLLLPYLRDRLDLRGSTAVDELLESRQKQESGGMAIESALVEAPVDQLRAMTDAAVLQANEAEFPADPSRTRERRQSAILLLGRLATLMDADETERGLLGSESAVTLALLLQEVGRHNEARDYALSAAGLLDEIASEGTVLVEPAGYPYLTYEELLVLGYQRAGDAESHLSETNRAFFVKAKEHFQLAIARAADSPNKNRWQGGTQRGIANLYIKRGMIKQAHGPAEAGLREFEKMRAAHDPILFYVSLQPMTKIAIAEGRLADARRFVEQASAVESMAHPGPIHKVILARQAAALHHAERQLETWMGDLDTAIGIAESAGLQDQLRAMLEQLLALPANDREYARDQIERLGALASSPGE